jgi:RNA polymerase sigma-70 factor (ECF subfamily)
MTTKSIEKIFDRNYDLLVLLSVNYVKSPEDAADIVMSIFESILNKNSETILSGYAENEIQQYLRLVTKHRSIDFLRKKKVEINSYSFLFSSTSAPYERNISIDNFEREAIERMLKILAKRESEILKMHLEGFSNDEIAERLDISYNTVRNTLTNTRNKIRSIWNVFMK